MLVREREKRGGPADRATHRVPSLQGSEHKNGIADIIDSHVCCHWPLDWLGAICAPWLWAKIGIHPMGHGIHSLAELQPGNILPGKFPIVTTRRVSYLDPCIVRVFDSNLVDYSCG